MKVTGDWFVSCDDRAMSDFDGEALVLSGSKELEGIDFVCVHFTI